jgi:outer membrane protein assembly factor BamE (lipoprotein component of BamABCDE complex)
MKKSLIILLALLGISIVATSCTTVHGRGNYSASSNEYDQNLTPGKIQMEIKKGMSGAEVTEVLGSPNIVTADENGLVTWVYDKIATEANYSKSSDMLFLFVYAQSNTSSNYTLSQKTITVVIKLKDNKVDSFAYHASKF